MLFDDPYHVYACNLKCHVVRSEGKFMHVWKIEVLEKSFWKYNMDQSIGHEFLSRPIGWWNPLIYKKLELFYNQAIDTISQSIV